MGKLLSSVLRHRVTIEVPVRTPDGQGGFVKEWECVETVWAKMEPLSGGETMVGQKITAQSRCRATIRHRTDITPEMRLVWDEAPYNIQNIVDPDGRKRSLELTVELGD